MAVWNLNAIQNKIRQVTGRYSPQDISNSMLTEQINYYNQYVLPLELKLDRFHTFYTFLTNANIQSYDVPDGYVAFENPAMINQQFLLDWYQDPMQFYADNPNLVGMTVAATGDGVTTAFAFSTQGTPLLPASVVIADNVETFEDTNTDFNASPVAITGSEGGSATVNYNTGAITVTFATAPADGQNINLSFSQFVAGEPTSILYYNNQFTFYPVPDQAYKIVMKAYANNLVVASDGTRKTLFTLSTDRPLQDEWGPLISFGTARQIHIDKGEMDAYQEVTVLYDKEMRYALNRTLQNLLNTRSTPQF
jgi:hypothetical protein